MKLKIYPSESDTGYSHPLSGKTVLVRNLHGYFGQTDIEIEGMGYKFVKVLYEMGGYNESKMKTNVGSVPSIAIRSIATPLYAEGVLKHECAFGKKGEKLDEKITNEVLYPFGVTRDMMVESKIIGLSTEERIQWEVNN